MLTLSCVEWLILLFTTPEQVSVSHCTPLSSVTRLVKKHSKIHFIAPELSVTYLPPYPAPPCFFFSFSRGDKCRDSCERCEWAVATFRKTTEQNFLPPTFTLFVCVASRWHAFYECVSEEWNYPSASVWLTAKKPYHLSLSSHPHHAKSTLLTSVFATLVFICKICSDERRITGILNFLLSIIVYSMLLVWML